jgi:thiol-disulfide isomerase/thioredoxin
VDRLRTTVLLPALLAIVSAATARSDVDRPFDPARPHDLMVGDVLPEAAITEWLIADDAPALERGTVYLLDFWTVWCTSCIASFPELSELDRRYRDRGLRVIAVSPIEEKHNSAEKIRAFVDEHGASYDFEVVTVPDATDRAWRRAAGHRGFPSSLLVDRDGRVVAVFSTREELIEQVLDDRHDVPALAEAHRLASVAGRDVRYAQDLVAGGRYDEAEAYVRAALPGPLGDHAGLLATIGPTLLDACPTTREPDLVLLESLARRAIDLAPTDVSTWWFLVHVHEHAGDFEAALRAIDRIPTTNMTDVSRRGRAQQRDAIVIRRDAVRTAPGFERTWPVTRPAPLIPGDPVPPLTGVTWDGSGLPEHLPRGPVTLLAFVDDQVALRETVPALAALTRTLEGPYRFAAIVPPNASEELARELKGAIGDAPIAVGRDDGRARRAWHVRGSSVFMTDFRPRIAAIGPDVPARADVAVFYEGRFDFRRTFARAFADAVARRDAAEVRALADAGRIDDALMAFRGTVPGALGDHPEAARLIEELDTQLQRAEQRARLQDIRERLRAGARR